MRRTAGNNRAVGAGAVRPRHAAAARPRGAVPAAARLALGALVFGALAAGCAGDDAGPAVAIDPAVMYAQNCARCHGLDGRGDPQIRKTLPNVRDFHDPEFLARAQTDDIGRTIMAGKGQMPAFGASLSLPKIQSLSGYVKRLGRGVARP
jgi:mono/diheme cytochrome c family protein